MTARKLGIVLAMLCAMAVVVPAVASASASAATKAPTHATSLTRIPVTGTARNGKAFSGRLTVSQFVTRHGKTMALGTLTGKLGNRAIRPTQVTVPVTQSASPIGMAKQAAVSCAILHLVLGPLHLNLLGLHVDLNQVVLDVTAVPGAGALLGNLLCGVANLLNTQSILGQQLTGLLNIVQQLTNTPALLGL